MHRERFPRVKTRRMRSIAQKRFTAVGRVAAKVRQRRSKSRARSPGRKVRAPRAIPMPAATPIAGAPRMTMSLIARATSRWSRYTRYTSRCGSSRWSIMTTLPFRHSIVRTAMQFLRPRSIADSLARQQRDRTP
jgi:hypothetical protein